MTELLIIIWLYVWGFFVTIGAIMDLYPDTKDGRRTVFILSIFWLVIIPVLALISFVRIIREVK